MGLIFCQNYCGGGQGVGGVWEMGEERAGRTISTMADSGIEIQKGKLSLFVTTYIQSKKWTQRFLTSIQRFPTLKAKFVCEKSQKMKIHTRDKKKQHYFLWNWKPFQVVYIIGHEWDGMTCVELIDCVSRVSVSSVSLAVEILRKNNKASQVKCRQRPFWSVSVFFGVVGKNPSMEDLRVGVRSVRL